MKATIQFIQFFSTLTILLITGVTTANAQAMKVTPNVNAGANLDITAQTKINYLGNSDGFQVRTDNASTLLSQRNDLIWACFTQNQPGNPGIFTLTSFSAAFSWNPCFTVRANGNTGIFNPNPGAALEVGTGGDIRQIRLNGSLVVGSDERIKENIRDISSSLGKLRQLRSVSYNFKKEEEKEPPIPEKFLENGFDIEKMKTELRNIPKTNQYMYDRNFYGFLAQDVQKLFPDLVFADSAGMLSVDYIGIIPLLVSGLKEQQEQIEKQQRQIEELQAAVFSGAFRSGTHGEEQTGMAPVNAETAVLYQNAPNPFKERTEIRYYLPQDVKSAEIYIFNLQGNLLKKLPATHSGVVEVKGSDLHAGMYVYALVANGQTVDTKRMILTK